MSRDKNQATNVGEFWLSQRPLRKISATSAFKEKYNLNAENAEKDAENAEKNLLRILECIFS